VKINDISITKLNLSSLRKDKISYIEQTPVLFTDTLAENTFLERDKNMSLYACGILSSLLDFIKQKSLGWNSIISPKNNNLSGGEKQRITLARALIKDYDVLIFDEPTLALDKSTADALIEYLCKSKKRKITILITHDERLIDICDEIIKL